MTLRILAALLLLPLSALAQTDASQQFADQLSSLCSALDSQSGMNDQNGQAVISCVMSHRGLADLQSITDPTIWRLAYLSDIVQILDDNYSAQDQLTFLTLLQSSVTIHNKSETGTQQMWEAGALQQINVRIMALKSLLASPPAGN